MLDQVDAITNAGFIAARQGISDRFTPIVDKSCMKSDQKAGVSKNRSNPGNGLGMVTTFGAYGFALVCDQRLVLRHNLTLVLSGVDEARESRLNR